MIPGGKTPILPATELQSMGFAAVAAELLRTGTTAPFHDRMIEFEEFNDLVGLPGVREAEERYCSHFDEVHLRRSRARDRGAAALCGCAFARPDAWCDRRVVGGIDQEARIFSERLHSPEAKAAFEAFFARIR